MRPLQVYVIALGIGFSALAGCQNKKQDEQGMLTDENVALRAEKDNLQKALESSENERRSLAMRISDLERQSQSAPTSGASGSATTGFEGVEGADVSVADGRVTVAMDSDVLFDSGKFTLKAPAKRALDQVAQVLNSQYSGKLVSVEGHTDTDPIRRSGAKSNHHLGFDRAFEVKKYLVSKGIPENRFVVASHGPNVPKGSKAKSRRVEIVVEQR